MDRQLFLTLTQSAQWLLFISLALLIYSWVEKKRWVQITGFSLFIALAIYAAYVMLSGIIVVPSVAADAPVPHEAKALSFFLGLIGCGVFAIVGLILQLKKSQFAKIPTLIIVPIALALFFMVYHLQRF